MVSEAKEVELKSIKLLEKHCTLSVYIFIIIYWWIIDFPYSHAVTPVQLRESEFMNYAWTNQEVGSKQMSTKNYWFGFYIVR